jgi:hypothetical protein
MHKGTNEDDEKMMSGKIISMVQQGDEAAGKRNRSRRQHSQCVGGGECCRWVECLGASPGVSVGYHCLPGKPYLNRLTNCWHTYNAVGKMELRRPIALWLIANKHSSRVQTMKLLDR